jgi:hypothetical protein
MTLYWIHRHGGPGTPITYAASAEVEGVTTEGPIEETDEELRAFLTAGMPPETVPAAGEPLFARPKRRA